MPVLVDEPIVTSSLVNEPSPPEPDPSIYEDVSLLLSDLVTQVDEKARQPDIPPAMLVEIVHSDIFDIHYFIDRTFHHLHHYRRSSPSSHHLHR